MKKIQVITLILLLNSNFLLSSSLFDDIGLNIGFNTFRLIGDNSAIQPQFTYKGSELGYSGGGLDYIEAGIDICATLFLDSNNINRLIVGGEYIGMSVKEIASIEDFAYFYKYHQVRFIDGYLGYHYSFYKAPWQNVRLYGGLELMFNNIISNNHQDGLKKIKNTTIPIQEIEDHYNKSYAFRFGSRIRAGFEGRIKEKIYLGGSFAVGFYNLLGRDNSTGELFNCFNKMDKKESFQPFFNFLISVQYRFNDVDKNK